MLLIARSLFILPSFTIPLSIAVRLTGPEPIIIIWETSQKGQTLMKKNGHVILTLVLSCFIVFLTSHSLPTEAQEKEEILPSDLLAGWDTISVEDMRFIVELLASDLLEGREAGKRGGKLASLFISSWFHTLNLESYVEEGSKNFFQEIPCLSADVDHSRSFVSLKKRDDPHHEKIFLLEQEVFHSPQSPHSFSITAPLLFAGYGIEAPEYQYNDYEGVDAKGKIVIVFNHEPQEKVETSIFKGKKTTRYSMPQIKAKIAEKKGALALIIIRDRNNPHPTMAQTLSRRGDKEERGRFFGVVGPSDPIPIFFTEDEIADLIVEGSGLDLSAKQKEIDSTLKNASAAFPEATLTLRIFMEDHRKIKENNVVGVITGSDKKLKEEAVIIGAHFDHLGKKNNGEIYYGADDNASGISALLSLAKAFQANRIKPKRSIIFLAFAGEEKGVIGSTFFTSHMLLPKENISAMINMDELGRNNSDKEENSNMAIAFMSGQSPELKEIIRKSNKITGLDIRYYPTLKFYTNSDHDSFHNMDIPIIFFFSGFHSDYHQPSDKPEKINYPKLEKLTKMIYLTVWDLANRNGKVVFDPSITQEPEKDEFDKPY
jgi:hypothetical protein